ncbi:MAG: hypothetical protein FD189_1206 [Elusimicrobia bacterium]|nr:MAG: hypothetical protein FD154_1660 [Elusimicrobiota bacterium]KAF0155958.1 MAG: hypothetical protein FD189_1206 [Elusimicrobiota bacterium]
MKIKGNHIILAIAACFIFSYSPAASAEDAQDITQVSAAGDLSGLKDILFKLVRQDELLDEAIENLEGASGPVTVKGLAGIKKTLGVVRKNLDHISWLNKKHFTGVQPGSETEKYTRTILSYSDKISRKSAQINAIAARAASAKNKSALRDAPSSKKSGKSARARSVTRILAEKDAWTGISAETKKLKGSSHKLKATSRWLHVASR